MKKLLFLLVTVVLFSASLTAQKLDGAFLFTGGQHGDKQVAREDLQRQHVIKIFKDGYWMAAYFGDPKKPFNGVGGGTYKTVNNKYIEKLDYYSWDSTAVGDTYSFDYRLSGDNYYQDGKMDSDKYPNYILREEFAKIKSTAPLKNASLEGAWLLQNVTWTVGGKEESKKSFDQIKIYSFPRFAWAQFNTKSKTFVGAGGGTYQFDGTNLVEHIEYTTYPVALSTNYEIKVIKEGPGAIRQESHNSTMKEWWKKASTTSNK